MTSGTQHEVDILVRARWLSPLPDQPDSAFFLVHVENQSRRQIDFNQRMFHYFARLHEKYKLPVYPVAVFSYKQPLNEEPERYVVNLPGLQVLDFRFHSIQLNTLDWREFVTSANPVAAALMTRMKIAPQEHARVKFECLRLLLTQRLDPARMQLILGFIDTYLPLSREEEEDFWEEVEERSRDDMEVKEQIMSATKSWATTWMEQGLERGLEQGLERGLEQGLERGLEQGLERGRREEAAALALRLLARRLEDETVTETARQRIRELSLEQLENLSEALLDFTAHSDLEAWLAAQAE